MAQSTEEFFQETQGTQPDQGTLAPRAAQATQATAWILQYDDAKGYNFIIELTDNGITIAFEIDFNFFNIIKCIRKGFLYNNGTHITFKKIYLQKKYKLSYCTAELDKNTLKTITETITYGGNKKVFTDAKVILL